MTLGARLRRYSKRALIGLLLLLVCVGAAFGWLLGSGSGRATLLRVALGQVNGLLPGKLQARELRNLGPSGLELFGIVVLDPEGKRVLELERLSVELDARQLLSGRIVVPDVELAGGKVDLRQLSDPRRGLLAAFVDPKKPPSPPSPGPPPFVRVEQLRVRGLDLRAPELPQLGLLEVKELELDASFELDGEPAAVVRKLRTRFERGGEALGQLEQLRAVLAPGGAASSVELSAELCGVRIEVAAEMVAPPAPSWRREPVAAFIDLEGVSGAALARLLQQPELAKAFEGSVALRAQAFGALEALWLELQLQTSAGAVALGAEVRDLTQAQVLLETHDFALARLRKGLPEHRLDVTLSASVDARRAEAMPIKLALRDSRLDATTLPSLDASGTLTADSASDLRLALRDGGSRVDFAGNVQLKGAGDGRLKAQIEPETLAKWQRFAGSDSGARGSLHADLQLGVDQARRVTAKGELRAEQIELGESSIERARVELDVRGELERPTGRVNLTVSNARSGAHAVTRLELAAQGGPERYQLAIDGDLDSAKAKVDLDVTRSGKRIQLSGEAQAELLDLGQLTHIFGLEQALHGTANFHAKFGGTPAKPNLVIDLGGRGLAWGERPPLDLDLDASFDAAAGSLDAKLALRAAQPENGVLPLNVALDLKHRFRGGAAWTRSLPDGELASTLSIERVDSRFVQKWAALEQLPVTGVLSGELRASGTRHDPQLQARLSTQADLLGAALGIESQLDYQGGTGALTLAVSDERGPWLTLDAALELASQRLDVEQLVALLPRSASDARWRLALDAKERKLGELPGLTARADLPAAVAVSLKAEHLPGAEPQVSLQATARPVRPAGGWGEAQCALDEARVEMSAQLADGKLEAELLAQSGSTRLLSGNIDAPLRVAPALAGKAPELGAIEARLEAKQLTLQSLPLVCGRAQGNVDLQLAVLDPLGKRPRLELELAARDFSMGAPQTADIRLSAGLAPGKAKADVEIRSGGALSQIHAELPITLEAGHAGLPERAPITLDASLRNLPIAPFLPRRAGISYASGSLDGNAEVRGTLDSPQLRGKLVLNDIAFTATDLAQPLRDVKGTIDFTQNRLVLKDFEAHDRDGVLKLGGQVDFQNRKRIALSLGIQARKFPMRQQGQVVATADIDAKVATTLRPDQTDVTIDLGAVDIWIESTDIRSGIALDKHPDFTIDGSRPESAARDSASQPGAPTSAPAQTSLTLNARDRVWIKRDDFAVKLRTSLRTRIRGDEAIVEGRVTILRGFLDLMGKTFDIEQNSYLDFTGSAAPDPVLAITAKHENRRSGTTVAVTITGRGSAPILTFRVDDAVVSAGDAFQAIYGSQQSNQNPSGANDQARAFVGGLTAGLLATTARRELGAAAPIIMIEPGEQSGEGRIRAGFEFDSLVPKFLRSVVTGVYFEGILANESSGSSGTQKSDARVQAGFLLELYYPHNLFSAGQQGPGTTWSIDVGWQL